MIRVAVVYPRVPGKSFDLDYYIERHMELVQEKLKPFGLKGVDVEAGVDETTPFIAIGSLVFETKQQYLDGFSTVGQDLLDDIPNYTTIDPVVQVSRYSSLSTT